eukprot:355754-Chlamydomonas_euryale.AAC.10
MCRGVRLAASCVCAALQAGTPCRPTPQHVTSRVPCRAECHPCPASELERLLRGRSWWDARGVLSLLSVLRPVLCRHMPSPAKAGCPCSLAARLQARDSVCARVCIRCLPSQISRLRLDLSSHLKWGRMVEPIVLTVLYTTICMVLPLFFPCTPTECLENDGVLYCATGKGFPDVQTPGATFPSPPTLLR